MSTQKRSTESRRMLKHVQPDLTLLLVRYFKAERRNKAVKVRHLLTERGGHSRGGGGREGGGEERHQKQTREQRAERRSEEM